jgi:hypothetical protein
MQLFQTQQRLKTAVFKSKITTVVHKLYNKHLEARLHSVKRHLLAVHNGETDAVLILFSDEPWVCSQ